MKHIINLLFFAVAVAISGVGNTCTDAPAVDSTKLMLPIIGTSQQLIGAQLPNQVIPNFVDGIYEMGCEASKMLFDDPIVFPGKPGASHLHVFFGNTSINANSDLMTLADTGNSTCNGGILNRSSYWFPAFIDAKTGVPILPDSSIFYYKGSPRTYADASGATITSEISPFPVGLRFIAGNSKATTLADNPHVLLTCVSKDSPYLSINGLTGAALNTLTAEPFIPVCGINGSKLSMKVIMPECWDGVNLDSPDHQSHMAYAAKTRGQKCPATHPVQVPQLTLHIKYKADLIDGTKNYRLSSDMYPANGYNAGASYHADFVNGWDPVTLKSIVDNCLNKTAQCRASLNNGTSLYSISRKDMLPIAPALVAPVSTIQPLMTVPIEPSASQKIINKFNSLFE